jgi:hypothetical protein
MIQLRNWRGESCQLFQKQCTLKLIKYQISPTHTTVKTKYVVGDAVSGGWRGRGYGVVVVPAT